MISKKLIQLAKAVFEDQENLILEHGLYNGKRFNDRFCLNLANMLKSIFQSTKDTISQDLRTCITSSFRLGDRDEEWDWRPYGESLMKRYRKVVSLWNNAETLELKKEDSLYDFILSDEADESNIVVCTNNNTHSCTSQENMLRYMITSWNSELDAPKEITGSGGIKSLQLFIKGDVREYIQLHYFFQEEVSSKTTAEIRNSIVIIEGGNIQKPKNSKMKKTTNKNKKRKPSK